MDSLDPRMMRTKLSVALASGLLAGTMPPALAASPVKPAVKKPLIKGEEVGYFGGATVTHKLWVFVYSNIGPRAGNQVTVCVKGTCEKARGHNASTAWYSAPFKTSGLRMGDPVTFTVVASTSARRARVKVTKGLLCMHNNGSTPQH
jgi:hypothetical protein